MNKIDEIYQSARCYGSCEQAAKEMAKLMQDHYEKEVVKPLVRDITTTMNRDHIKLSIKAELYETIEKHKSHYED